VVTSKCSWHHFISKKYKTVQTLKLHFFKIVPLCDYTLIPMTVKLLETFLEAILWKHSQLFVAFLIMSIASQCSYQSREQAKNQLQSGQERMGDAPVLSHFFSYEIHETKLTGVLEHCREWEANCWFSIFQVISFWPYP